MSGEAASVSIPWASPSIIETLVSGSVDELPLALVLQPVETANRAT
jgi:hypothetical protein